MTLFKRLPLCLLLITSNVWAEELPRAAQRTENMAIAAGSASALTSAMYLGDPIMDYEDMVRRDTLFEDLHRHQRLRVSSRENLLGANMRLVYSNAAGKCRPVSIGSTPLEILKPLIKSVFDSSTAKLSTWFVSVIGTTLARAPCA
jgi:hypothetical protein